MALRWAAHRRKRARLERPAAGVPHGGPKCDRRRRASRGHAGALRGRGEAEEKAPRFKGVTSPAAWLALGRPGTRPVSVSRLSGNLRMRTGAKMSVRAKKSSRPAKIIAAVIVLMIIIGSVFLITSYGQGAAVIRSGLKLYADGSYADAVSMFEAALAKDEGNSEYLINLGMAYIALGQYDDALAAFENSISNTSRGDLLNWRKGGAVLFICLQDIILKLWDLFKEALAYGNDEYTEQELDILYYLAEAQDRAGDAVGAAESYTKIIEHQEDANAYMLRGIAYQRSGDNGRAETDLKTALDMSKKRTIKYTLPFMRYLWPSKDGRGLQYFRRGLKSWRKDRGGLF